MRSDYERTDSGHLSNCRTNSAWLLALLSENKVQFLQPDLGKTGIQKEQSRSTHVEFSKAVLHGSSDTTEEQCLHNPLPSLPNLPKMWSLLHGPSPRTGGTTPLLCRSHFFLCLDIHSLQESHN